MQVKILDTLYNKKVCQLVYMQDITGFVGSALHCLQDPKTFTANMMSMMEERLGSV